VKVVHVLCIRWTFTWQWQRWVFDLIIDSENKISLYKNVFVDACMYVCVCKLVSVYVWVCMCECVCMCVCICVCMRVCAHANACIFYWWKILKAIDLECILQWHISKTWWILLNTLCFLCSFDQYSQHLHGHCFVICIVCICLYAL